MITTEQKNRAHQDADYIFKELFPQCGMKERQGQTGLCHEMLDAMFGGKIMLSDAGTGIGKTYAYLTAAVIFHKYRMEAGYPGSPSPSPPPALRCRRPFTGSTSLCFSSYTI